MRIHLILLSYHILVILPSHFSSMEQMLMLTLNIFIVTGSNLPYTGPIPRHFYKNGKPRIYKEQNGNRPTQYNIKNYSID